MHLLSSYSIAPKSNVSDIEGFASSIFFSCCPSNAILNNDSNLLRPSSSILPRTLLKAAGFKDASRNNPETATVRQSSLSFTILSRNAANSGSTRVIKDKAEYNLVE